MPKTQSFKSDFHPQAVCFHIGGASFEWLLLGGSCVEIEFKYSPEIHAMDCCPRDLVRRSGGANLAWLLLGELFSKIELKP